MDKSFNNIAGGPFQSYVSDQINNRKEFLKESHKIKENKHLLYNNNKNSFIRITSNTLFNENHPLAKKYNLSGDKLAKKYILQGGTINKKLSGLDKSDFTNFSESPSSDDSNYSFKNRGGIGNDGLYNMINNKPLGFKPMPGITSISISSSGKLGTLQYGSISFICYDKEQLEIMDSLYMKLGFSLLIEWGHTLYIKDDLKLQKPQPLNPFHYNNKEELIKDIQKNRESHQGNYDAMLGTISNFGWDMSPDGSYLCNITVVGAGDVLDSLKINHSTLKNRNLLEGENNSTPTADKNLSSLNKALYKLNEFGNKFGGGSKFNTFSPRNKGYREILNSNLDNGIYDFLYFGKDGFPIGHYDAVRGNHHQVLKGLTDSKLEKIHKLPPELFNLTTVNFIINNSSGVNKSSLQNQTYITLGHLLALITAQGLIYSNGKPYIYIDFHHTLNLSHTYYNQISLDPKVCIIPNNYASNLSNFKTNLYSNNSINSNWKEDELSKFLKKYNRYLDTDNPEVRANMMWINININAITNILSNIQSEDKDGEVHLSKFLNILLQEISSALGNNNNFRVLVDDSSKVLRIIDDNRLNSLGEMDNDDYTELPIFGKDSFIYNYNFKSKIGPNMASMITISAQAEPSIYTKDLFSLSNLSRGLQDRLMPDKKIINDIVDNDSNNKEVIQLLDNYLKGIYQGNKNSFILNTSSTNAAKTIYEELTSSYRNNVNPNQKGTTIIPLEFNIELDGLSGIIPNSAFIIPTNLLPSNYLTKEGKVKIAFIIHKIDQIFNNNKWITKLVGQTINIRFDKEDSFHKKLETNTTKPFIFDNPLIYNKITPKQKELQSNIVNNGELPQSILRSIDNEEKYIGSITSDNGRIRLYNPAAVSLSQLLEKAEKDKIKLKINSAYRTLEDQVNVRKLNAPTSKLNDEDFILNASSTEFSPYTAIPGTSNHGFGLAVDFANISLTKINESMSEYEWLKENAPQYGFKRIPSEPWHWEYQNLT